MHLLQIGNRIINVEYIVDIQRRDLLGQELVVAVTMITDVPASEIRDYQRSYSFELVGPDAENFWLWAQKHADELKPPTG